MPTSQKRSGAPELTLHGQIVSVEMREINAVTPRVGMRHSFGVIRPEELMREMLSEKGEDAVAAMRTRLEGFPNE